MPPCTEAQDKIKAYRSQGYSDVKVYPNSHAVLMHPTMAMAVKVYDDGEVWKWNAKSGDYLRAEVDPVYPDINPNYVAYAKFHGKTPDEMKAHDSQEFPGGCMAGFMSWINQQKTAFYKAHPEHFIDCFKISDLAEWSRWLQKQANQANQANKAKQGSKEKP